MSQTLFKFNGKFGVDGVIGGDLYPFWEVSEETYKKILPNSDLRYCEQTKEGKYKLFLSSLFEVTDEGKQQKVRISIETQD